MSKPIIHAFFDVPTNTVSYLVGDPETKDAAVIDPVLDYDHKSGKANVTSADAILAKVKELAEKLTTKNVKEIRAALLALGNGDVTTARRELSELHK